MTNWEFRIQKEGDQAWLPLESATAEIVEGRYQLMAQVGCVNESIWVTILHQYDQDGVWQETEEEQLHQTDNQGLLQILPVTYLGSGLWTIRCSPCERPPASESQTETYLLLLQVLEEDYEFLPDWEIPSASPAVASVLPVPVAPDPALISPALTEPAELDRCLLEDLSPAAAESQSTAAESPEASELDLAALFESTHPSPSERSSSPPEQSLLAELEQLLAATESSSPYKVRRGDGLRPAYGHREPAFPIDLECFLAEDSCLSPPQPLPMATEPAPSSVPAPVRLEDPQPPAPELLLPTFARDIPVLNCQRSPGLILPPELYPPSALAELPAEPQLPVFSRSAPLADLSRQSLSQLPDLSLQTLSRCARQISVSLDLADQAAIDQDFASLSLHQRFWQTLNTLALQSQVAALADLANVSGSEGAQVFHCQR